MNRVLSAAAGSFAATVAASILLTLILAAAVIAEPSRQIFGFASVGRHHDPFTMIEQYVAGGAPRPYLQPITDFAGVALIKVLPPLTAYNALVLLTFPLSAAAAFLHARHVTRSVRAAVLAALLFMLSPFHLAHAAYHVHIAQIQWLPLLFLMLWRLFDRPTTLAAMAFAATFFATAMSSFYLGFIAAITATGAAVAFAWFSRNVPATDGATHAKGTRWVASMLIVTGLALAGASWFWGAGPFSDSLPFAFPVEALDQHTARWWSYVLPPAGHPLFGDTTTAIWHAQGIGDGLLEQQLSLGLSVLVLAAIGAAAARAKRDAWSAARVKALIVTAAIAVVCSLPPSLQLGVFTLPMPSAVLFDAAPMFRAYARFGVIVSLVVTTLAGAGFAALLARKTTRATTLAIVLLVGAAIEYLPSLPLSRDVLPTSGHRLLADRDDARVLDCCGPDPGDIAGMQLFMRAAVSVASGPLQDCADPELGGKLAAFGFTHVIVRRPTAVSEWLASGGDVAGLRVLRRSDDALVFDVVEARPSLYTTAIEGLYAREFRGRDSWRWLGRAGQMVVTNPGPAAITRLALDVEAYGTTRRLRVVAEQRVIDTLIVPATRGTLTTAPFTMPPGVHTIRLEPDAVLVPAEQQQGSADTRALSMRLFGWQWRPEPLDR